MSFTAKLFPKLLSLKLFRCTFYIKTRLNSPSALVITVLPQIMDLKTVLSLVAFVAVTQAARNPLINGPHAAALSKNQTTTSSDLTPCTCGIFLTGQFKKISHEPPKGNPALQFETETVYPCNPAGFKMCQNKCLDSVGFS